MEDYLEAVTYGEPNISGKVSTVVEQCINELRTRGFIKARPDELAIDPLPTVDITFKNGSQIKMKL